MLEMLKGAVCMLLVIGLLVFIMLVTLPKK